MSSCISVRMCRCLVKSRLSSLESCYRVAATYIQRQCHTHLGCKLSLSSWRAVIVKHTYNIYLLAYGLWWVSVFIIVAKEGFHPRQDLPWFVVFTLVVIGLRWLKIRLTGDNNWVLHKGASPAHKAAYHGLFAVAAALMLIQ